MAEELKLEQSFMHTHFASWRLQRMATINRYQLCATGHASGVATTALDFLHTRASVLRNHLLLSEGRIFLFTQSEHRPGYFVYELLPVPSSDQGLLASQVAELGADAGEAAVGGAVEAVVDCSLAVVAEAAVVAPPGSAGGAGAAHDSPEQLPPPSPSQQQQQLRRRRDQLLLSRGHGDIVLMWRRAGHVWYSNAVYPLRPRLPYTGVRPLILEAAFADDNGDITAVCWAMRSKGPHTAACCEVFAVTLRPSPPPPLGAEAGSTEGAGGGLQLTTVDVRLLLRTKLPPPLVRVLPPGAERRTEAGADRQASTSGGGGGDGEPGGRVVLLGFDPNTAGLEGEQDEGGPAPVQAPPANVGDSYDADDDDDMDPRTLDEAAARLAHLTSSQREGAQPAPQWADLFKESGPDGVGALGAEPAIDLAAWRLQPIEGGGGGAAAAGGGDKPHAPFWRLCCGAHRLLTAEGPVRSGPHHQFHQTQTQQPQPLLLGVTDDVDCAVLRLDPCGRGRRGRTEPEGEAPAGETSRPGAGGGVEAIRFRHLMSIPALAYVAAGKTFKRHLLITSAGTEASGDSSSGDGGGQVGPPPGGSPRQPLAAVLLESQRFMYLYGSTSTREEYGRQQVVELGLEVGETVLGARLLEVELGAEEVEQGAGGAAGYGTSAGCENLVVVATQRRLLSYRLRM